jgi:hypothetical protein
MLVERLPGLAGMTPQRNLSSIMAMAGIALAAMFSVPAAWALDEQRGEEAAIKACDLRLCQILVSKNPAGDNLKCTLTKTWARSSIKEADSNKLSWGFGDARCSVDLDVSRATLVTSISSDEAKFRLPPHTANCVIEQDGKLEKVTAVVSPKIVFKAGKAEQVWVNLKSVEGPAAIELTVKTAAYLADTLGLFHKRMIKQINRYIERHCPEALAEAAKEKDKAKGKPKAKAAAK